MPATMGVHLGVLRVRRQRDRWMDRQAGRQAEIKPYLYSSLLWIPESWEQLDLCPFCWESTHTDSDQFFSLIPPPFSPAP